MAGSTAVLGSGFHKNRIRILILFVKRMPMHDPYGHLCASEVYAALQKER